MSVHVRSVPYHASPAGGDLHYVTTCGAQNISRFALWDIAGHGSQVAAFSKALRRVLRRHINTIDQSALMRGLNHEMAVEDEHSRFATGLLATYDVPTGHVVMSNAGHPPAMWFRAKQQRWVALTTEFAHETLGMNPPKDRRIRGLPLGIIDGTEYEQVMVPLESGDLLLLYTDAVTECTSPDGEMLGVQGLADWLNKQAVEPAVLIDRVVAAIAEYQRHDDIGDDITLMLLERTDAPKRAVPVLERLQVIGRMFGIGHADTLVGHHVLPA